MKIAIACPSLNYFGGAERLCMYAIHALRSRDTEVVLATLDKTNWVLLENIFGQVFKPDKESFLFKNMPRIPVLVLRQAFVALGYAFALTRLARDKKYDMLINMRGEIIETIGDMIYVNAVPLKLMHAYPEIQPEHGVQWRLYGEAYSLATKFLRRGMNIIVANSVFNQDIIRKKLGKNALVVHPAVDLRKVESVAKRHNREDLVITISRFRSAKGLEIIPRIAQQTRSTKFALIGSADGDSEKCLARIYEEIRELAVEDRVQVFINVPFSFVLEKMRVAKMILHTQPMEAFGMAIVEAMASGCVPVVPRQGGPWVDILDQKQGIYGYSFKSVDEASRIITMLLGNEKLRAEVSARACLRAMEFDSSLFEKRILAIVKKAGSSKEKGR